MKVVLAVIAAVLVLTIGTTAVALAQDGSTQPPQWQPGACGANMEQRVALAVEKGLITQAEADEITAWLAERPAALDKLMGFGMANGARNAFGGQSRMGRGMGPGMMGGGMGHGMMGGGWRFQQQVPPTQTN